MVKEALRDLIREEPAIFKSIVKEVLTENGLDEDGEFDRLLKKNFERFDETFRALA